MMNVNCKQILFLGLSEVFLELRLEIIEIRKLARLKSKEKC